jgi:hypothetical protein
LQAVHCTLVRPCYARGQEARRQEIAERAGGHSLTPARDNGSAPRVVRGPRKRHISRVVKEHRHGDRAITISAPRRSHPRVMQNGRADGCAVPCLTAPSDGNGADRTIRCGLPVPGDYRRKGSGRQGGLTALRAFLAFLEEDTGRDRQWSMAASSSRLRGGLQEPGHRRDRSGMKPRSSTGTDSHGHHWVDGRMGRSGMKPRSSLNLHGFREKQAQAKVASVAQTDRSGHRGRENDPERTRSATPSIVAVSLSAALELHGPSMRPRL